MHATQELRSPQLPPHTHRKRQLIQLTVITKHLKEADFAFQTGTDRVIMGNLIFSFITMQE